MTQSQKDIALEMKQEMSAGQFDRAAMIGAQILRLHSNRTDIQIMTAVSELQAGSVASAGRRLKKLFNSLPLTDRFFGPVAQNFLQYAYQSNDYSSFESAIKKRLRTATQKDRLSYMLADVIFQRQLSKSPGLCFAPGLSEAIDILNAIPGTSETFDEAQMLLARVYLYQEKYMQTFSVLEGIVARKPDVLAIRMLLASSYSMAGEVERAVTESLEIIRRKPTASAQPYLIISFMRPQSMPDNAAGLLDAMLDNPDLAKMEHYKAAFARAKIEEIKGNMKEAFDFYRLGHRAHRTERPFNMARELSELARLHEMVRSAPVFEGISSENEDGPRPIFIVGMPRSGTTLTERILGAHPDVHAAGEIGDFAKAVIDVVGRGQISDQLARIDAKAAKKIRKQYLAALKAYAPEKRFVTNKTPANFLRVEMIRRVFPDAPIIHTHRHPLATCLSIYTTPFSIPMRYSDDLAEFADYYRGYVGLMNTCFEADHNGQLYDLSYEDLVSDPEAVAQDYL
ncbi:tetratricopeptide repeat-containing sulfotransferase family protein, partial [Thalassospira sp. UBA1131]|uniref:tetratricopeptide repeat-containing sulfotransferase family protein n=1 Tax=Thalassospira sp. UBA1131 TaxID=1947672 RepID=UPI0025F8A71D